MQITAIREAECPNCEKRTSVSVRRDDEFASGRFSTPLGERRHVTCPNGHTYWVTF